MGLFFHCAPHEIVDKVEQVMLSCRLSSVWVVMFVKDHRSTAEMHLLSPSTQILLSGLHNWLSMLEYCRNLVINTIYEPFLSTRARFYAYSVPFLCIVGVSESDMSSLAP